MLYLLSRASRAILKRLAQERTLCAFDFDGTLSPIVEHPDQAVMGDKTRSLLGRLAALYPFRSETAGPGADALRIRFRRDALAHCRAPGPGSHGRQNPEFARPAGCPVSMRIG